jgi:excisionase family DNA binding protein
MKIKITANIRGKEEILYTISDSAKYLGISRQAVLKMVNNAVVRAVRTPEFYLIPLSDLKKLKKTGIGGQSKH